MPFAGESTILVPVDISTTESPDRGIVEFLGPTRVVLLGYYPVPDQAAPARIKDESESEAQAQLTSIAGAFEDSGVDIEDVLVFTHDRQDTIDRVADQYDCDAVLTPRDADSVDRLLVPLRSDTNLERIIVLLASVAASNDVTVTLFHAVGSDSERSEGEFFVRGAADRLAEEGLDRERIDWQLADGSDPKSAITDLASEYDLVVLGETEPSLRERILGDTPARIIDAITKPTLVVRDVR